MDDQKMTGTLIVAAFFLWLFKASDVVWAITMFGITIVWMLGLLVDKVDRLTRLLAKEQNGEWLEDF